MSNELITKYHEESVNNNKIMINALMKELPDNVIVYQLEKHYHVHRMNNRQIRALFSNVFSKIKRVPVPKVKSIALPDILVPELTTTRIICLKDKIKNRDTINYIDWVNFKNYFVYDQKLSDKKLSKSQIKQLSNCKKTKSGNNMFKKFMGRFSDIYPLFIQLN